MYLAHHEPERFLRCYYIEQQQFSSIGLTHSSAHNHTFRILFVTLIGFPKQKLRPPYCSTVLLSCIHQDFHPLKVLNCRYKSDSRPWHGHYAPLTGTDVQVQQQKQSWHDHYKNVQAASTDEPVGEDDLVWALECVRSRAFSGPYSGKSQATGLTAQTLVMARYCLSHCQQHMKIHLVDLFAAVQ